MKKFIMFTAILLLIAGGAFVFLSGDAINALIKEKIDNHPLAPSFESINTYFLASIWTVLVERSKNAPSQYAK